MRALSLLEARVLGVLVEKQSTVPDSYPLSLNALVLGCNQKTAREPVMNLTEAEALSALDGLKALNLVFETSGSRVVRFEHNLARALGVPSQAGALLATLVLRGAQTAAELRLHAERLHRFADVSSVEGFLDELAAKSPARVVKLPRAVGEREARWAHLLCGEPTLPVALAATAPQDGPAAADRMAVLEAQQLQLAQQLDELRARVDRLAAEHGIAAAATSTKGTG